jgi:hypothetical protein
LLAKSKEGKLFKAVQPRKQLSKLGALGLLIKSFEGTEVNEVQLKKELEKLVRPPILGITEVSLTLALSASVIPNLMLPFDPKLPDILIL